MTRTTMESIPSLCPQDAHRLLALPVATRAIAWDTEKDRRNPDFVGSYVRACEQYLAPETREKLGDLVKMYELASQQTQEDPRYDHETHRLERALQHLWRPLLGEKVLVHTWVPGEVVRTQDDVLELTGDACPSCGVNPEAHGYGGGVRCLSKECGWWFCY